MHRQLSRPTAAIRKITSVVPLLKGGTGGANATAAAAAMGVVSRNSFNVANGVARLNNSSLLELAYLPASIVNTATIEGPTDIYINAVTNFTISNYDANTSYVISVSSGSFVRTGSNIAFTAPGTIGTVTLTINGKACSLIVKTTGPLRPSIVTPTDSSENINDTLILTSSAYVLSSGTSNHNMSDWEIATDYAFTSIVKSTYGDGVNKLSWPVSGLSANTVYYTRMRHKDAVYGYSSWSEIVKFKTKADFIISTEDALLLPSIPIANTNHGFSTSLDGTGVRCAVGNYTNGGVVYIFNKTSTGWIVEKAITGLTPGHTTVALDSTGTRLAIGSPNKTLTLSAQGSVLIYTRTGTSWSLEQEVICNDPAANDYLGRTVEISLDGTRMFSSTPSKFVANSGQGCVYVFLRTGTVWAQEAKLTLSDPAASTGFGGKIAISQDGLRLGVSCVMFNATTTIRKAVYVFLRTGVNWAQEQKVVSTDTANDIIFGNSFYFNSDGTRLAVGDCLKTGSFSSQGAVYTFTRAGSVWTQEQKLLFNVPAVNQLFGNEVIMNKDGTILYISLASITGGTATAEPGVHVYNRVASLWSYSHRIVCSLGTTPATEKMGRGMSLSSDGTTFCSGIIANTSRETVNSGGAVIFN